MQDSDDQFNLMRFLLAQGNSFERAVSEIRSGQKVTHWMWFIFPQFEGLGFSYESQLYSIRSLAEARAYLRHPILGPRLTESTNACLSALGKSARDIFGTPDDLKLRSSMTLFALVSKSDSVFRQVLDQFFEGGSDERTLQLIDRVDEPK